MDAGISEDRRNDDDKSDQSLSHTEAMAKVKKGLADIIKVPKFLLQPNLIIKKMNKMSKQ